MKVSRNKGPKWLADKWDQSNLQLHTLIDPERENAEKIIQEYVCIHCIAFSSMFHFLL